MSKSKNSPAEDARARHIARYESTARHPLDMAIEDLYVAQVAHDRGYDDADERSVRLMIGEAEDGTPILELYSTSRERLEEWGELMQKPHRIKPRLLRRPKGEEMRNWLVHGRNLGLLSGGDEDGGPRRVLPAGGEVDDSADDEGDDR